MSFRPRSGIMAMMATVAATFAGMSSERRAQFRSNPAFNRYEARRLGGGSFFSQGHQNNKAYLSKLRKRRTRNKLARISRRANRG